VSYDRKKCALTGCENRPTHVVFGRYASVRTCCDHYEEPSRQIIWSRMWPAHPGDTTSPTWPQRHPYPIRPPGGIR